MPPFLHWAVVVGPINTGWASDEVQLSVNVVADPVIVAFTVERPSSWKFPLGVWIVQARRPPNQGAPSDPDRATNDTSAAGPSRPSLSDALAGSRPNVGG